MIKKMTQYLLQRRCALSLLLMLMLLQPAMAQAQTRQMYARLDKETQTLTLYYGSNYKESDYGISLLFGRPLWQTTAERKKKKPWSLTRVSRMHGPKIVEAGFGCSKL